MIAGFAEAVFMLVGELAVGAIDMAWSAKLHEERSKRSKSRVDFKIIVGPVPKSAKQRAH